MLLEKPVELGGIHGPEFVEICCRDTSVLGHVLHGFTEESSLFSRSQENKMQFAEVT